MVLLSGTGVDGADRGTGANADVDKDPALSAIPSTAMGSDCAGSATIGEISETTTTSPTGEVANTDPAAVSIGVTPEFPPGKGGNTNTEGVIDTDQGEEDILVTKGA